MGPFLKSLSWTMLQRCHRFALAYFICPESSRFPPSDKLITNETYAISQISPARIPLPRSLSYYQYRLQLSARVVLVAVLHLSIPISKLLTISSERPSTETPSERLTVIITDDINRLLQYLHRLENDRQCDNQGIYEHLSALQNELHDLADYIYEKAPPTVVPPPIQIKIKDQSVGGESVVSWGSPQRSGAFCASGFPMGNTNAWSMLSVLAVSSRNYDLLTDLHIHASLCPSQ